MEKKERRLGRDMEELSRYFLSAEGEAQRLPDERLASLEARLESLESWLAKASGLSGEGYVPQMFVQPGPQSAAAAKAKAKPGAENEGVPAEQPAALLERLRREMGRDYLASGIIWTNGLHLAVDAAGRRLSEEEAAAYFARWVCDMRETVAVLGLGVVRSLCTSTDQCHILLSSPDERADMALFLVIRQEGNLGLANILLRKYAAQLK